MEVINLNIGLNYEVYTDICRFICHNLTKNDSELHFSYVLGLIIVANVDRI